LKEVRLTEIMNTESRMSNELPIPPIAKSDTKACEIARISAARGGIAAARIPHSDVQREITEALGGGREDVHAVDVRVAVGVTWR
jgi:hypothetical protein